MSLDNSSLMSNQPQEINREAKFVAIQRAINDDLPSSDLKFSVFYSAAISSKPDFLLLPFPPKYICNQIKQFDKLIDDLDEIPDFKSLLENDSSVLSDRAMDLLYYILITPKYNIKRVHKSEHNDILKLAKSTAKSVTPQNIFKIEYSQDLGAEKKFQQMLNDSNSKYAYHGTKFCNMYSILNHGLQQHLNKTNLYGDGLYLANELQISLMFSQHVKSWPKSTFGDLISNIALCEYLDNPQFVTARRENGARNSDIPYSYLLITNNEIVRVRYLLIYNKNSRLQLRNRQNNASIIEYCSRHPVMMCIIVYFSILLLAGISNQRYIKYYISKLFKFNFD